MTQVSKWQDILQQAVDSIGLDVLFFLINDAVRTGYFQSFSIRTLAARTNRSHRQIAKKVRVLECQELIHLAGEKKPGISLNIALNSKAPVNRFLMAVTLEGIEKIPVYSIPKPLQKELAELRQQVKLLQNKLNRQQTTIEKIRKKYVDQLYRPKFDFTALALKIAEELEQEIAKST